MNNYTHYCFKCWSTDCKNSGHVNYQRQLSYKIRVPKKNCNKSKRKKFELFIKSWGNRYYTSAIEGKQFRIGED